MRNAKSFCYSINFDFLLIKIRYKLLCYYAEMFKSEWKIIRCIFSPMHFNIINRPACHIEYQLYNKWGAVLFDVIFISD